MFLSTLTSATPGMTGIAIWGTIVRLAAVARGITRNQETMANRKQTYAPKDRIEHAVFGLGTILEIDEQYALIAFDESGTRKFVTSMVKLAPSDAPPPARRVRKGKRAKR
jgi:hypothetical protein